MAGNRQPINEEERVDKIENAAKCLDEERSQGLEQLQTLQTVKNTILEREQKRLTQKYGANHPRTQKVTRRLTYNRGLQQELDREIDRSKIQVPVIDADTWLVNGRVLTREGQGISELTISLFNEKNRWIRELGFTCTDERGYFAIAYSPQNASPEGVTIPDSQPLTLTVTDSDRQILHQEKRPLFVTLGAIDYREIILEPDRKTPNPPEPDDSNTPPDVLPQPNLKIWQVRGQVRDARGQALESLSVGLRSKNGEDRFELGTAQTNARGEFILRYSIDEFEKLFDAKPDLFLVVLDKNGDRLFRADDPLTPEAGRIERRAIEIPRPRRGEENRNGDRDNPRRRQGQNPDRSES